MKLFNVHSLRLRILSVLASLGAEWALLYRAGYLLAIPNNTPSNVLPIRNIADNEALMDKHCRISFIRVSKYGIKQLSTGKEDNGIPLNSVLRTLLHQFEPPCFFVVYIYSFRFLKIISCPCLTTSQPSKDKY